jgi:hypothetical protein
MCASVRLQMWESKNHGIELTAAQAQLHQDLAHLKHQLEDAQRSCGEASMQVWQSCEA